MSNLDTKVKSFWERPEGTTGMLFIAGGVAGLWVFGGAILAFLATMTAIVGQAIMLAILGSILAAIIFVASDKRFRTAIAYMLKSAMRAITSVFWQIDPIGIMKSYIDDLRDKREKMAEGRNKLNGQIKLLETKIRANTQKYNDAMKMVKVARDQGNQGVLRVNANQAGRMQKLNDESFIPLLEKLKVHLRAIDKYYEVTGIVVEDLKNEVEAREMERETMKASYGALTAAKKIIQGGTSERELFDQAMEFVVEDYHAKLGEIDSFLSSSQSFVEGLDMQQGVYQADALEALEQWEKRADSVLLGESGKRQLLEAPSTSTTAVFSTSVTAPVADFADLLKR